MGQSKLLMPWDGGAVIDAVLQAWCGSRVDTVVTVVRSNNQRLIDACRRWPVQLVMPDADPPDMKASVQIGLRHLAQHSDPGRGDCCFIAPADMPTLTASVIDQLIDAIDGTERIVVPDFAGRIGHPVLLPWPLTDEVFALGHDQGINRIVQRHDKLLVRFPADAQIGDIDTPQQYQAARDLHQRRKTGTNDSDDGAAGRC